MRDDYVVYWCRLPEHSNPYCQGYIGITNDFSRRQKEHTRAINDNNHFHNALQKHKDDVIWQILHKCDKESALDLEYSYRPETNIGWNYAIGGEDTLSSIKSRPVKLFHKDDPTDIKSFSSITEAANTLNLSYGRIVQAVNRGKTIYGYDGWAVLHDDNWDVTLTLTINEHRSMALSGVPKNKPNKFKGMVGRWSEEDKLRIGLQHRGKSISEEHRKAVSEKNKLNPNLCKYIELVHESDVSTVHKFHSISEAAKQLQLPLSRLKSKAQRPINKFGKDGWAITKLGSE